MKFEWGLGRHNGPAQSAPVTFWDKTTAPYLSFCSYWPLAPFVSTISPAFLAVNSWFVTSYHKGGDRNCRPRTSLPDFFKYFLKYLVYV